MIAYATVLLGETGKPAWKKAKITKRTHAFKTHAQT